MSNSNKKISPNKNDYVNELNSGKYIFKYCKFNVYTLQILISKYLYFCKPNKLNDPLDSQFILKIKNPQYFSEKTRNLILNLAPSFLNSELRWGLKNIGLDLGWEKTHYKFFKKYFNFLQNTFLGICSFSREHSENVLWSHYSNEAKGLCLVFDKELLIESLSHNIDKDKKYSIIKDIVTYTGIKNLVLTLKKDGDFSYTMNHLFSKTKSWEYEKEYRIILDQIDKTSLDFCPIKYEPYVKFDDNCLKYIITGQRIETEHYKMLWDLKDMKVFEAYILNHTYDY